MTLWLFSALNILPVSFFPVDFLFYFPVVILATLTSATRGGKAVWNSWAVYSNINLITLHIKLIRLNVCNNRKFLNRSLRRQNNDIISVHLILSLLVASTILSYNSLIVKSASKYASIIAD